MGTLLSESEGARCQNRTLEGGIGGSVDKVSRQRDRWVCPYTEIEHNGQREEQYASDHALIVSYVNSHGAKPVWLGNLSIQKPEHFDRFRICEQPLQHYKIIMIDLSRAMRDLLAWLRSVAFLSCHSGFIVDLLMGTSKD